MTKGGRGRRRRLCCRTTGLKEVRARSRRSSSFIKRSKKKRNVFFLLSSKCLKTAFTEHNAISVTAPPQSINYKLSPYGERDREGGGRREGSGLTIAAWADINLSKLMEVSIMLCYGWGGCQGSLDTSSRSITPCFHANNSKSIQPVSRWRFWVPLDSFPSCHVPQGHVTYTLA